MHLNVRRLNKIFEKLKNLLIELKFYFESLKSLLVEPNFCFKMSCIAKYWCSDNLRTNSRYQQPNYVSIHPVRRSIAGGGIHKD